MNNSNVFPCTIEICSGKDSGKIIHNVEHADLPSGVTFRIISKSDMRPQRQDATEGD